MRAWIAAVPSIVLLGACLAACSDDAGPAPESDAPDAAIAPQRDGAPSGASDAAPDAPPGADAHAADGSTAMDGSKPPPPPPPPPPQVICEGPSAGLYCGNDMVQNGDPDTLYDCPGSGKAPTSATPCKNGCVVEPQGQNDQCKPDVSPNSYELPWPAGTSMQLTQDCNDSCCGDHVGNDEYAWDWANGKSFQVVAARGGTVTHLKINSTTGCGTSSCVNDANFIVIDHGDGTESVYLHLAGFTLANGVSCGATVSQGQPLAMSGTTGWSTGIHLHFQVNPVHAGAPQCECGADGQGCATTTVPWSDFWVSSTYPSKAISFVEWPSASQCADRRITMPASQN